VVSEMSLRRGDSGGLGEAGKIEMIGARAVCGEAAGANLWRGGG
jgi:hypothetical protein